MSDIKSSRVIVILFSITRTHVKHVVSLYRHDYRVDWNSLALCLEPLRFVADVAHRAIIILGVYLEQDEVWVPRVLDELVLVRVQLNATMDLKPQLHVNPQCLNVESEKPVFFFVSFQSVNPPLFFLFFFNPRVFESMCKASALANFAFPLLLKP